MWPASMVYKTLVQLHGHAENYTGVSLLKVVRRSAHTSEHKCVSSEPQRHTSAFVGSSTARSTSSPVKRIMRLERWSRIQRSTQTLNTGPLLHCQLRTRVEEWHWSRSFCVPVQSLRAALYFPAC